MLVINSPHLHRPTQRARQHRWAIAYTKPVQRQLQIPSTCQGPQVHTVTNSQCVCLPSVEPSPAEHRQGSLVDRLPSRLDRVWSLGRRDALGVGWIMGVGGSPWPSDQPGLASPGRTAARSCGAQERVCEREGGGRAHSTACYGR